jgi:hypothetical protein
MSSLDCKISDVYLLNWMNSEMTNTEITRTLVPEPKKKRAVMVSGKKLKEVQKKGAEKRAARKKN